jgi:Protein of unknown function (DUF3800)
MLIFFDETFRESLRHSDVSLGALCGIGIRESELSRVESDVFQLKYKHMGSDYARNHEIKGKDLLKNYVFKLEAKGIISKNLALAKDLIEYIVSKRLPIFGCVCFEKHLQRFQVDDVTALDKTFYYLFERIDMFMKVYCPDEMASLIFDDRDYGINQKNSAAITNFFQRSARGLSMDSIVKTPFFAISQSQNVGLQLADFVTTVIGLRFSSHEQAKPYFAALKEAIPSYQDATERGVSCLKVMRGNGKKVKALDGRLSPRSGQESPTSSTRW